MRMYKDGDIKQVDENYRLVYIQLSRSHQWNLQVRERFLWWGYWSDISFNGIYYVQDRELVDWIWEGRKRVEEFYNNAKLHL